MEFPETIEGFGYKFSEDGKLQHIETGKPFEFLVKENDYAYNQNHYEALGELITPYIYQLLEERCGLQRHPVPIDASETEPKTFIFCSENFNESEKLLVLIHGSGVVRAGQWARRLIINDSLNSGTQIPFIERGLKDGYGILVMNTNDNYRSVKGSRTKIRGSESADSHGRYVWKNYVWKTKAQKIAIVAHSYGGAVTTRLFGIYEKEIFDRVFAVALTDSVHYMSADLPELRKIGRNWVTSQHPLDTQINRRSKDIPCMSAGCVEHEMTSWSSFESIFKFFYSKLLPVTELHKHASKFPATFAHSLSIDEDEEVSTEKCHLDLKSTEVEGKHTLESSEAEGKHTLESSEVDGKHTLESSEVEKKLTLESSEVEGKHTGESSEVEGKHTGESSEAEGKHTLESSEVEEHADEPCSKMDCSDDVECENKEKLCGEDEVQLVPVDEGNSEAVTNSTVDGSNNSDTLESSLKKLKCEKAL